jgi:RNA exonuclease NGL2
MLSSVPGHKPVSTKGPGKLHGLVILYKAARMTPTVTKAVALDDEELTPEAATPVARRGVSRQTRNMGLIVALQEKEHVDKGLIVVTTHL